MTIETIPANDRRERFVASGGQTIFPFDFPIYTSADLAVLRLRAGVETTLALGADYTLAGANEQAGGTLTLTVGATAGDVIVLLSNQASGRQASFTNGGDLPSASLEAEFNRLAIQMQQALATVARALRLSETDPSQAILPPATDRANRNLGFDANGSPVAVVPEGGTLAVTPYALSLLSAAAASAARGVLGSGATGDAVFLAATQAAARTTLGVVPAPGTGAAVAATSGSNIDFTGIPPGVRRVVAMFSGLSTNGTLVPTVQAGTSGGVVASGYLGAQTFLDASVVAGTANLSTGFSIGGGLAVNMRHGAVTMTRVTANTWIGEISGSLSNTQSVIQGSGTIALGAELDRIRFSTGGADTFDGGIVNVTWEY